MPAKKAGIGFAMAQKLADCGANVILADAIDANFKDQKPDLQWITSKY